MISDLAEIDHCATAQVDEAASKLKIGRATVYRLLAHFKESQDTSSLLPTRPGRKAGGQMLEKAQERIISDLIRKVYLSKQKPTVAALHRTIALECFNAKVPIPSYRRCKVGLLGSTHKRVHSLERVREWPPSVSVSSSLRRRSRFLLIRFRSITHLWTLSSSTSLSGNPSGDLG